MDVEQFENALRQFLRREPFQPFVVELIDGRIIEIDRPDVAFNGGAATFVPRNFDLVEFTCEETRAIHPAVPLV